VPPVLADGAGAPVDQGVSTFLFIGAVLFGIVAAARLRGRAFTGLPLAVGWLSAGATVACLVLAVVLPPIIRPDTSTTRPSTTARLTIVSPRPGQTFRGHPATIPVRLRLTGGRIVRFTSTKLVPNEGHVHLFLDRNLISMTYGLTHVIRAPPGTYRLTAEFVAVDHLPWNPPVKASVRFRVVR
jgi:hypothetical protein